MGFLEQAELVLTRGIYVVPTYKGLRHPALPNWQDMASNDPQVVKEWGENGYKDFNCVCVTKNEATLSIDAIDDLALLRQLVCRRSRRLLQSVPQKAFTYTFYNPMPPECWATEASKSESRRFLN